MMVQSSPEARPTGAGGADDDGGVDHHGETDVSENEEGGGGGEDGEAAEGGESGDEGDKKRKKKRRARRAAEELNLLRDPSDIVVELTEPVLQELAGNRKLHQLRYPTFVVCTHANFQLRTIEGLRAIKGTALKELDLSLNKLLVLDGLEQFSTLKTLRASRNQLADVTVEKLPRLRVLDLSHNRLDGLPDLLSLIHI